MASLSLLSCLLPVAEYLHMSITTTMITVKTNTHHEQQEGQPEVRQVAQEQQDEQTKNDQPKSE
jgi:hypothetical protein